MYITNEYANKASDSLSPWLIILLRLHEILNRRHITISDFVNNSSHQKHQIWINCAQFWKKVFFFDMTDFLDSCNVPKLMKKLEEKKKQPE